jgi:hypothetical protein
MSPYRDADAGAGVGTGLGSKPAMDDEGIVGEAMVYLVVFRGGVCTVSKYCCS